MLTLRVLIADDQQERALEYARLALSRVAGAHAASRDFVQTEVAIAVTVSQALQRIARSRCDGAPFDVLVTDFFFDPDRRETAVDLIRQLPALGFGPEDLDIILVSREAEAAMRRDQIEAADRDWRNGRGRGITVLLKDAASHDEEFLGALYACLWDRMESVARRIITVDAQGFERTPADETDFPSPFKTVNPVLREKIDTVLGRFARLRTPVLITGESGTGKEELVKAIHKYSGRERGPLVALNIASLPEGMRSAELFGYERGSFTGATVTREGLIETAEGGTLFLDEVGELPPDVQVTLLRVLQEKESMRLGSRSATKVDFRLICATNRDLEQEIRAGRFREDLYYRIKHCQVHIPPLRDRPDDIHYYTEHWWKKDTDDFPSRDDSWDEAAKAWMAMRPWRGNVRDLQTFVERVKVLAPRGTITRAVLEKVDGTSDPALPGLFNLKTSVQRHHHLIFFPAAERTADHEQPFRAFENDVLKSHWFLFGNTEAQARHVIKEAWRYHRKQCVECAARWSGEWDAAEFSGDSEASA